jgi:hypothetical protein
MTLKSNLPYLVRKWLAEDETRKQKDLAKEADISEGTLSRLLHSDHQRIDLDVAQKLQKIIKFDERDLVIRVREFAPGEDFDRTPENG